MNWYKLAQFATGPLYIASDLDPNFIMKHGFVPQYKPEDWGMGSHLMVPCIFLANENAVKRYHVIHEWKGRPYLYKVENLDKNAFYPDIPSLYDLGAYFDEQAGAGRVIDMFQSHSSAKNRLKPFMDYYEEDDGYEGSTYPIFIDEILPYDEWRLSFTKAVFDLTGTIAYTKPIPSDKIEFIEETDVILKKDEVMKHFDETYISEEYGDLRDWEPLI